MTGRKKDAPLFLTLFICRPASIAINVAFRVPAAVCASAVTLTRQRYIGLHDRTVITMKLYVHANRTVTLSKVKSNDNFLLAHSYTACVEYNLYETTSCMHANRLL